MRWGMVVDGRGPMGVQFRLRYARESAPPVGVREGIPREVFGDEFLLTFAHMGNLRVVPLGVMLVLVVANLPIMGGEPHLEAGD